MDILSLSLSLFFSFLFEDDAPPGDFFAHAAPNPGDTAEVCAPTFCVHEEGSASAPDALDLVRSVAQGCVDPCDSDVFDSLKMYLHVGLFKSQDVPLYTAAIRKAEAECHVKNPRADVLVRAMKRGVYVGVRALHRDIARKTKKSM